VSDGSSTVHLTPSGSPLESVGVTVSAEYRFQTSIVEADPGNGNFRMDNATPASVTELFISSTTDNGIDLNNILGLISVGDQLYIQQDNDASKFILFDVTANVDNTGWFSIAGTASVSGTIFDNNAKCHILILFGGTGGAGGGDVFKVGTPVDNQVGIWTGDGTIEGAVGLIWSANGFLDVRSSTSPGLGSAQTVATTLAMADGTLLAAVGFGSSADFQITNFNHGGNILIQGEDVGGTLIPFFTLDPDLLRNLSEVPIYFEGQAAAGFDFLNHGQFWVRDDSPTTPMFTNSFGTDFELNDGDVNAGAGAAEFRIAVFDGSNDIIGDANFTYGLNGNPEQMMIQVDTNTINEVGLLFLDPNSIFNPDGFGIMPGQAGLFDGSLIFTDDPTDTVNNRNMTMVKNNSVAFGKGCAVAAGVTFRSESAGALAYFQPQDITGREETKISFVGEVGGTGHEGVFSIEGFAYGDAGLQFHRMAHFVIDADYTLHTDLFGTLNLGTLGANAPVLSGDNAAIGYTQANGLELTGQGTDNDLVIFDDGHQLCLSKPSGSAGFRFHQRFSPTRFTEFEQGNPDFSITSEANVTDFLIGGYSGLLDIASDLTVEGIRPSGTVEWDKGADIASATTLVLGSDGNSFDVTGTTDIEAISAKPIGTVIILQFDAVARLIYDATALDLDGDVDMVPETNDTIGLYCYDGTNWRELFRTDGQGVRVSGSIADQSMVRGNGGAKRVQDTGNLIGDDDEIIMAGTVILQSFTDAQLNDDGNSVNTNDGKAAGAMVFNSTQGHAVTAQGSGSGDVWNDGVGTTTNTPV